MFPSFFPFYQSFFNMHGFITKTTCNSGRPYCVYHRLHHIMRQHGIKQLSFQLDIIPTKYQQIVFDVLSDPCFAFICKQFMEVRKNGFLFVADRADKEYKIPLCASQEKLNPTSSQSFRINTRFLYQNRFHALLHQFCNQFLIQLLLLATPHNHVCSIMNIAGMHAWTMIPLPVLLFHSISLPVSSTSGFLLLHPSLYQSHYTNKSVCTPNRCLWKCIEIFTLRSVSTVF